MYYKEIIQRCFVHNGFSVSSKIIVRFPNLLYSLFTSTGNAPGINSLEISPEEALIVCENGKLRIGELVQELGGKESSYRQQSDKLFQKEQRDMERDHTKTGESSI